MASAQHFSFHQVQSESTRLGKLEGNYRNAQFNNGDVEDAKIALQKEVDTLRATGDKTYNAAVLKTVQADDVGDKNKVLPMLTLDHKGLATMANDGQLQYSLLNTLNQRGNYSPWEYDNKLAPANITTEGQAYNVAKYDWSHAKNHFTDRFNTVLSPRENAAMKGSSTGDSGVSVEKLPDGYARLKITDFMNGNNEADVAKALKANPDVKGWIVDLRENGGGYVDQALNLASMFVKKGTLTTIRSRVPSDPRDPLYETKILSVDGAQLIDTDTVPGRTHVQTTDRVPYLLDDKPVVILANKNTASAAEIFTSALHDNHAATVVGETSYGKGEGQTWRNDMDGGYGIKTTSLHYYTPNGKWLGDGNANKHGIVPDLQVTENIDPKYGTDDDLQLVRAWQYLQNPSLPK
jgi:Peptidase family S41